jgi:hypothetical protein
MANETKRSLFDKDNNLTGHDYHTKTMTYDPFSGALNSKVAYDVAGKEICRQNFSLKEEDADK